MPNKSHFGPITILCIMFAPLAEMLWRIQGLTTRLPAWDQAAHGLEGLVFAHAIKNLDPMLFISHLSKVSYWPPLYAFFQAPFFIIFGYDFSVSRILGIPLLLICAVAVTLLGHRLKNPSVGLLAAALMFLSGEHLLSATTIMLELPGTVLTLFGLYFYAQYTDTRDNHHWKKACVFMVLTFFCKYNYGIMLMFPILVWELLEHKSSICNRTVWRHWLSHLKIKDLRPFHIFFATYLGFLIYVKASGGLFFELNGKNITIKNVWGNPLYILVAITTLRIALFRRQSFASFWKQTQSNTQIKDATRIILLPIAVWMLYPENFKTFFVSIFNESTRESFWSLKTLTFYPMGFAHDFSPNTWVGLTAFFISFLLPFYWKSLPAKARFIYFFQWINFIACILHPNHIVRYLYTICPIIWLNASLFILISVHKRFSSSFVANKTLAALAVALFLFLFPSIDQIQGAFHSSTTPETFRPLLGSICRSTKDLKTPVLINHSWHLNPSLVKWYCLKESVNADFSTVPETLKRRGFHPERNTAAEVIAQDSIDGFVLISAASEVHYNQGFWTMPKQIVDYETKLEASKKYTKYDLDVGQIPYKATLFVKKP